MGYNVVFEGKPRTACAHIRTYTGFPSAEAFMEDLPQLLTDCNVVAVGVTDTEAQQICKEGHDLVVSYYGAVCEAFKWETGEFYETVFADRAMMLEHLEGPCPNAIKVMVLHLSQGKLKEPVPLHMVYNISSILTKRLGGVLEDA